MDNPPGHRTNDDAPPTPGEADLRAAMDQSDADLAAGLTVPLADVLAELDGIAQATEGRRRARWVCSPFTRPRHPWATLAPSGRCDGLVRSLGRQSRVLQREFSVLTGRPGFSLRGNALAPDSSARLVNARTCEGWRPSNA